MKRLRIHFLFVLLAAAAIAIGHRSWLSREVVVSVGLKAPGHIPCQIFYADGRLSRRGFSFTAMAAPFRWEFVPGILREWRRTLSSVASFTGVEAECKGGGQPGRDTAANDMLGAFRRASLHDIPDDGGGTAARTAVERALEMAEKLAASR